MGATGQLPSAPAYRMDLANLAEGVTRNDYWELVEHVRAQLPEALRPMFRIIVRSDAFMLAPRMVFTDLKGRTFETDLRDGLTLPPEFLALLNVTE